LGWGREPVENWVETMLMIRAERGQVVRPGRVSCLSVITVRVGVACICEEYDGVERTSVGYYEVSL
jgi:hypothetical protein